MPTIRPISDLRNKAQAISQLCHSLGEPVFITKNGKEDLVVMSQAAYEREQDRLELYRKLAEAEEDVARGDRGITHREMMRRLKNA
ncbi:MAG: type II toxin-antitoxin system prevent-host-death family antitoxin [Elusimicrobia bacterium]|nr:type II toxin-antitoxin system prevent-host-death family antitoxin [Elusimicrobiota bacterium]